MAWCRTHGAIDCPCGGRIVVRYETLIGMLTSGVQGTEEAIEWIKKETEAEFSDVQDEIRDYARDHPNLSDRELQRHVYEVMIGRLGREYISISSAGVGVRIETGFGED